MSLIKTTAQDKIGALRRRIRIVQGGTSSSKTFTIIPILIMYAIHNPNSEISIVSESIPHLRRGAIRDFLKIMGWLGNDLSQFNRSTLTYFFKNGSFIEFFSADQSDKLRGARRDVLFVNEANNIDWESYFQMAIRTRKFIYIDYNPTSEFWAHKELIWQDDTDFIILTYKDNEALEPAIVKEIEAAKEKGKTSSYWANWYKVYGLGEVGSLQGVVFQDWKQIDKLPKEAQYLCSGLDFGFTNSYTALIDLYKYDGSIIVDESLYRQGMTNNEIAAECKKDIKRVIYADSAEPKSIEEIRRYGVSIKSTKKGKDSINYGIDILHEQNLKVTSSSVNLIRELRGYVWDADKENVPIKENDHAIDAMRYAAIMKLGNKKNNHYVISG